MNTVYFVFLVLVPLSYILAGVFSGILLLIILSVVLCIYHKRKSLGSGNKLLIARCFQHYNDLFLNDIFVSSCIVDADSPKSNTAIICNIVANIVSILRFCNTNDSFVSFLPKNFVPYAHTLKTLLL